MEAVSPITQIKHYAQEKGKDMTAPILAYYK